MGESVAALAHGISGSRTAASFMYYASVTTGLFARRRLPRLGFRVVPGGGGLENRVEIRVFGGPGEQLARAAGIGHQHGRVTEAARRLAPRNAPARHALGGRDHLANRMARAGDEVDGN